MLTHEQLMNHRVRLTDPIPFVSNEVGEIFELRNGYVALTRVGRYGEHFTEEVKAIDFPANFWNLNWWEERDITDYPEYVKLIGGGYIHKVLRWTGENNLNGVPLYHYLNRVNYESTACAESLIPATQEEYEEYLSKRSAKNH